MCKAALRQAEVYWCKPGYTVWSGVVFRNTLSSLHSFWIETYIFIRLLRVIRKMGSLWGCMFHL